MKNKSLVANIGLAILSVLLIAFLALPYITSKYSSISGYDCFETYQYMGGVNDAVIKFIYVLPLLMMILAVLVLVISVLNILGETKVIKSEKLVKVLNAVNLVIAIVLAVMMVAGLIMLIVKEASLGAGFILNLIFAVATVVGTALTFVWGRK